MSPSRAAAEHAEDEDNNYDDADDDDNEWWKRYCDDDDIVDDKDDSYDKTIQTVIVVMITVTIIIYIFLSHVSRSSQGSSLDTDLAFDARDYVFEPRQCHVNARDYMFEPRQCQCSSEDLSLLEIPMGKELIAMFHRNPFETRGADPDYNINNNNDNNYTNYIIIITILMWANWGILKFPSFFSYFSSKIPHFCPQFGPPGGRVARPGRPWLRPESQGGIVHCESPAVFSFI